MQSFCIGAVKGKYARFPQTAPTDVAGKLVDDSQSWRELEDLQKEGGSDRTWHWFGAGLGGSDAFVSRSFPEKCRESNLVF
jgi:hypothetical protein